MTTANVLAELTPATPKDLEVIAGQDGADAAKKPWVAAEVTCEFQLVCSKIIDGNAKYWMAFPIFAKQDPDCRVTRFEVAIDGKVVDQVETLGDWRAEPAVEVKTSPTTGKVRVARRPPQRLYSGYQWPTTAKEGASQKVQVVYRLILPAVKNRAFFRYVLRSGSLWDGPIGLEIVTVKADKALEIEPRPIRGLEPVRQKDGSWRWMLKDVKPTKDIVLTAKLAPAPPDESAARPAERP
jgi:hypothetical protein